MAEASGSDRPEVNTRVGIRLDGCCTADLHSRVEDVGGGQGKVELLLAAPNHPCGASMPDRGSTGTVRWVTPRAVFELPVAITGTRRYPRPGWELASTGDVKRVQRRQFVRVSTPGLPVGLKGDGHDLSGRMLDISEGGLRSTVSPPVPFAPDDRVIAWIQLSDGLNLALPARIVRVVPSRDEPSLVEVACQFVDVPKATTDELRRWVFARELAERRRAAGLEN
jgi:hypothetical protein